MDRVRVRNTTLYDIGLKSQSGIEYSIRPHAFNTLPREEVEYSMAIAPSLFSVPCQLVVEDEELNQIANIDPTVEGVVVTPEVCEKYLKGSPAKLKAWLEENRYPHVLEQVCQAAEKMDLSMSKMKILKEIMPKRNFEDE